MKNWGKLSRSLPVVQGGAAAARTAAPDSQCTHCQGTGTMAEAQYFVSRGAPGANGGATGGSSSCTLLGSTTAAAPSSSSSAGRCGSSSRPSTARFHLLRQPTPTDTAAVAATAMRGALSHQAEALSPAAGSAFGRAADGAAASGYGWWHTLSETRTPAFWAGAAVAATGLMYGGFCAGQQCVSHPLPPPQALFAALVSAFIRPH